MFRGSILFAALLGSGHAQPGQGCESCNLNLAVLEEFTANYDLVVAQASYYDLMVDERTASVTTTVLGSAMGPSVPSDHGTLAVHARNLQLKLDNHLNIPEHFHFPRPNPILNQLLGHEIHEELHINGAHGMASFHLGSPVLNACIQVDVPVPPINHAAVEDHLHQAEQIAAMVGHQEGHPVVVDGVSGFGIATFRLGPFPVLIFDDDSHPEMVVVSQHQGQEVVGFKFSNFVDSVGNAFSVRACEVEAHTATQTMLAENPEVREFFAERIAEHQKRLQAVLEPTVLNTRFNFVPLQVADLMLAPSHEDCANDVLAEAAPMALSTFQTLVVGACSLVMGITATYGAMRKKAQPSDAYYQVSA